MASWFPRTCLALGAATTVAACSLSVNVDAFDDGVCPAGTKACNGSCVSETDPSVGCSLPGCSPCDIPNAVAYCSASGTCAFTSPGSCTGGSLDCNGLAADGCEADVRYDPSNCGACGCRCGSGDDTDCPAGQTVKAIDNGTPGCRDLVCVVGACSPGWGDCNGDASDGCETLTNKDPNCGTCGSACGAAEACVCLLEDASTGCECVSLDGSGE
jgi:hypothetical protein